jgi:hypothetical protein
MGDCAEPRHVHVKGGGEGEAKVWLDPVELAANKGYTPGQIRRVLAVVSENREVLTRRWDEECGVER